MAKPIGKKLMGLFVQIEEDEKAPVQETSQAAPAPSHTPVQATPQASSDTADTQVAQMLTEALEQANLEGYDYFEFAKTIDSLKPTLPSEQTLFQTAFISGKVMGASKEKLVQTASTYLEVLNKKAQEFDTVCQSKIQETVTSREDELKNMETAIQEKAAQIQRLTEEINQMTAQKTQVTNEIAENRVKIETKRNNFAATLRMFTGRISADVEKINRYIQ